MKKVSFVIALLLSSASIGFAQQPVRMPPMRLTTTAFADGTVIPFEVHPGFARRGCFPPIKLEQCACGNTMFCALDA